MFKESSSLPGWYVPAVCHASIIPEGTVNDCKWSTCSSLIITPQTASSILQMHFRTETSFSVAQRRGFPGHRQERGLREMREICCFPFSGLCVFFASADFIHSSSSSFRSLDTVVSSSPNIKNLSSSFESTPRCPPSSHFVNYFLFGFVIILILVSFSPLFSFLLPIIRKSITMSHVEGCLDS